jgi:hypothetical protein
VRSVVLVVFGAFLFGVAMSVLKGDGAGARDAIGNLSAPWLLLPFIAGAAAGDRRVGRAAVVGVLVSLVALGGFYLANTFVLGLGRHSWLTDVRLTFAGGHYFELALLSGPVFGALGGLWQQRGLTALGVLVAALLVIEPLGGLVYERADHLIYTSNASVWAIEVVVGIGACALAATVARPRRPSVS